MELTTRAGAKVCSMGIQEILGAKSALRSKAGEGRRASPTTPGNLAPPAGTKETSMN